MKIAIVVDSAVGLTKKQTEAKGWHFIPLYILSGEKSYRDGIDINTDNYFDLIPDDKSKLSTSTTPIGEIHEIMKKLSSTHDKVVFFPISQGLSSQYSNLKMASKDFDNVDIIPSKDILAMIELKISLFENAIQNGQITYDQGIDFLSSIPKDMHLFLVPKNLNALVRGGRLSPSAAKLANLISIVPVIDFVDGKLEKGGKGRNYRKTFLKRVSKIMKSVDKNKKDYLFYILHFKNEDVMKFKEEIEKTFDVEVLVSRICPIIGVHIGPGALAFGAGKKIRVLRPKDITLEI